jgi:hypothetical protein
MILAAHSDHVSGRAYGPDNGLEIELAPAWMEERIIKAAEGERVPEPINFQAHKDRKHDAGATRYFAEGERNDGLRDVACGRWRNGWATDAQDLYAQLCEVRDTRCAPGKKPPPSNPELYDLALRTVRKYARGEMHQQGGAA